MENTNTITQTYVDFNYQEEAEKFRQDFRRFSDTVYDQYKIIKWQTRRLQDTALLALHIRHVNNSEGENAWIYAYLSDLSIIKSSEFFLEEVEDEDNPGAIVYSRYVSEIDAAMATYQRVRARIGKELPFSDGPRGQGPRSLTCINTDELGEVCGVDLDRTEYMLCTQHMLEAETLLMTGRELVLDAMTSMEAVVQRLAVFEAVCDVVRDSGWHPHGPRCINDVDTYCKAHLEDGYEHFRKATDCRLLANWALNGDREIFEVGLDETRIQQMFEAMATIRSTPPPNYGAPQGTLLESAGSASASASANARTSQTAANAPTASMSTPPPSYSEASDEDGEEGGDGDEMEIDDDTFYERDMEWE